MSNREQVLQKVEDCYRTMEEKAGYVFSRCPIFFDLKGRTAGQFLATARQPLKLRFNEVLMRENFDTFLVTTVPHEVAHSVAYQLAWAKGRSIKPHGPEWQQVMRMLGVKPKRCHSYDTSNSRSRNTYRHVYSCNCKSFTLSTVRHNRCQKGSKYTCKDCRGTLVFKETLV